MLSRGCNQSAKISKDIPLTAGTHLRRDGTHLRRVWLFKKVKLKMNLVIIGALIYGDYIFFGSKSDG